MRAHYELILKDTEKRALRAVRVQTMDEKSPWYGAFPQNDGVYQAKSTIYCIESLISCYCCPDSSLYHSQLLLERAKLGLDYVDSVQHENGLFDYITCNFSSAPDTAFCILKFIPILQYLMEKESLSEGEAYLKARMDRIVHAGGRGLLEGGFHTTAGPSPPFSPSAANSTMNRTWYRPRTST